MLGMNDIASGADLASRRMEKLVDEILAVNPEVTIYLESLTPMTKDSTSRSDLLNNDVIAHYNENLKQLCRDRGWIFLDVGSALKGEDGCFMEDYCWDPRGMGMHPSPEGTGREVNYIRTHVAGTAG